MVVALLTFLVVGGFGLRAYRLSAEALSEDELNKVRAVADYRARGLTPANGEHPFLMKALLTASTVACEAWNSTSVPKISLPTRKRSSAVSAPRSAPGSRAAASMEIWSRG